MGALIDYVTRKVVFRKNVEGKPINLRIDKDSNRYIDALIKRVMNDIVTIVYIDNYETKEITFTLEGCFNHIKTYYNNTILADVVYSTTLNLHDAVYLEKEQSIYLFMDNQDKVLKLASFKPNRDLRWIGISIDEILSGEVVGKVWNPKI